MSEKGKEAGIAVTAEELARINRFAKKELRAKEVYTFAVKLCDNEVDRDFERFDRAALEKLSELFVGRTGIFDHSWSAGGQTARRCVSWRNWRSSPRWGKAISARCAAR